MRSRRGGVRVDDMLGDALRDECVIDWWRGGGAVADCRERGGVGVGRRGVGRVCGGWVGGGGVDELGAGGGGEERGGDVGWHFFDLEVEE